MDHPIFEAIKNRQSIYTNQFTGEELPEKLIHRMLDHANHAPSHKRTYPWRFVVFSGDSLNSLFDEQAKIYFQITPRSDINTAKLEKMEKRKSQVSHAIAIVCDYHPKAGIPPFEEEAAVACAVQNMWLTLSAYPNAGGYWSTGSIILSSAFETFLGLGDDQKCLGMFYAGTVENKPELVKRPDWRERVEFR